MDGKYVGNRPIRLSKIKDEQYGSIETVAVSGRKVGFCFSPPSHPTYINAFLVFGVMWSS
jgi:hypothetical protein